MQPQTLWDQMIDTFLSPFRFPGLDGRQLLLAIALGVAFGAIWLLAYRPRLKATWALVGVAAVSALITWSAIAFVQLPLETGLDQALLFVWDESTVATWVLLAGVPAMLITGLVQEGGKLLPVVAYRARARVRFDARTGLLVGAIAGAGFGVFEAIWVHNTMFAADPTWETLRVHGLVALVPIVERFFAVGLHIGASALAGYGLATGRGWQLYLAAACLHGLTNYGVVLLQAGILDMTGIELWVAGCAVGATAVALRLRWWKTGPSGIDVGTPPRIASLGQPS